MQEQSSDASGKAGDHQFKEFKATFAHSGFTLVSVGFILFEVLFVFLYCNDFWFSLNLSWFGIPAVLATLLLTHFLLLWQESTTGCAFFSFIKHGRPLVVYRRWVRINDPLFASGIRFGNRNITWNAITNADLTLWGNLVLRSRSITGEPPAKTGKQSFVLNKLMQPDTVLKLPFGIPAHDEQTELILTLKRMQPNVVLNPRLEKRLEAKELKAAAVVPLFGVVFMGFVLLDVGYGTFNFLEMLKGYYLAQVDGIARNTAKATIEFDNAENIRIHPLPISWVTAKLLSKPPIAPGLYDARGVALWALDRKDEAVDSVKKAIEMSPKSFRLNLRLARMLVAENKIDEAKEQLQKAMDNKQDSFLPQLYTIALKQGQSPGSSKDARAAYKEYKGKLDEELFKDEPRWPPGNNLFLHDVWYREDVEFVFDRLIGKPAS